MEQIQPLEQNQLILNDQAKYILENSTKWTRFLAVIGYILASLMALGTLVSLINSSSRYNSYRDYSYRSSYYNSSYYDSGYYMGSAFATIILLVICGVYFAISYYLMSYANNMRNAIRYNDSSYLEVAFRNLNNHFKTIGIIIIVYLSILVLILFFGMFALMSNGFR